MDIKIQIFIEDGCEQAKIFIINLIERLKEENIICKDIYVIDIIPVPTYTKRKLARHINSLIKEVDRVIVIYDADESKYDCFLRYVPEQYHYKIRIVKPNPEFEEWICVSLDLKFGKEKPSKVLEKEEGYKKCMNGNLLKFLDRLNFNKLLKNSDSFKEFVESLKQ